MHCTENVDTPEPDEKSLITYISSLYDVFPEPPPRPPLVDPTTLKKYEEYKEISSRLHLWIRESISMLQDRNFPGNLMDLKALQSDCNRFRVEDVPPRLAEKQRIAQMYRELLRKFESKEEMELDAELEPDTLERNWSRMLSVHQERDLAIKDEISKLERLQRLADKVNREAKQCETKLEEIEKRIEEEEKRIERLNLMDAKHNCDQLDRELRQCEDSIKSMVKDVQALKDGRFYQANDFHRRVQRLHQQWVQIRMLLQSRLLTALSKRSFTTEERTVTRQTHTVFESRLVDTNEQFKFLQECIDWVENKLVCFDLFFCVKFMDDSDYGNDLPSIQVLLDQHQNEHKSIDQFQKNVDQCHFQKYILGVYITCIQELKHFHVLVASLVSFPEMCRHFRKRLSLSQETRVHARFRKRYNSSVSRDTSCVLQLRTCLRSIYSTVVDFNCVLSTVVSQQRNDFNHGQSDSTPPCYTISVIRLPLKKFKGDELSLYNQLLLKLEKGYSELLVISNKRLSDLELLLDFIQSATQELMWMNEKEEIELSRDWSLKNLDLVEIEHYYESLMREMETREMQKTNVQDEGEKLVMGHHPAAKCIEAYMAAMQTQWSWLIQLTMCLDTHLKNVSVYHQFFSEVHEYEDWISRQEQKLNSVYSKSDFGLDEGEKRLKEMQVSMVNLPNVVDRIRSILLQNFSRNCRNLSNLYETCQNLSNFYETCQNLSNLNETCQNFIKNELRDDLTRYGEIINSLIARSKDVVQLKQRRQSVARPLRVKSIIAYKQVGMSTREKEMCTLYDNSQKGKWKVMNSTGSEGLVPGVCFTIEPPNQEAIDRANKLKRHYDTCVTLWQNKQRRMRQNMIFATIKVVRSWDLGQFQAMEPAQRDAIAKALNDDAQKLIQEGPSDDPGLRRLREEMKRCNDLFAEFRTKMARGERKSPTKTVSSDFNETAGPLQKSLDEAERILASRSHAAIPRDLDTLEHMVIEHKGFENSLQLYEVQVANCQDAFRNLQRKSPAFQARMDTINEKWEILWSLSHMYIERLKCVEIILTSMEEATQLVSEYELKLASSDDMPSELEQLRRVHQNLLT
uniref:SH3 domain-containing protein n=1 Tax=Strigamia maritima TaxID=126957 RepID=T1IX63_STRMM